MVCIVALVSVSATVVLSLFYELGVTQQRLASLEAFSSVRCSRWSRDAAKAWAADASCPPPVLQSAFASTGRAMEAFDHVDARQRSIADENVVLRAMVADARRWVAGGLLVRVGGCLGPSAMLPATLRRISTGAPALDGIISLLWAPA